MPMNISSFPLTRAAGKRKQKTLCCRQLNKINFQSIEYGLLNQEMNDLNAIVNNTSREINLLILRSGAINDTINKLIEKSRNDRSLLDTIQNLYNHDIIYGVKKWRSEYEESKNQKL